MPVDGVDETTTAMRGGNVIAARSEANVSQTGMRESSPTDKPVLPVVDVPVLTDDDVVPSISQRVNNFSRVVHRWFENPVNSGQVAGMAGNLDVRDHVAAYDGHPLMGNPITEDDDGQATLDVRRIDVKVSESHNTWRPDALKAILAPEHGILFTVPWHAALGLEDCPSRTHEVGHSPMGVLLGHHDMAGTGGQSEVMERTLPANAHLDVGSNHTYCGVLDFTGISTVGAECEICAGNEYQRKGDKQRWPLNVGDSPHR